MERKGIRASLVALCLLAAVLTAGCDSIDPTEQTFAITFRNDTGRDVYLKLCSDGLCRHSDYSDEVRAGESHGENVSDRDLLTRWRIEEQSSTRILGCLPLKFDQKYDDVLVNLSQMVPCPGSTPLVVKKGKPGGRH